LIGRTEGVGKHTSYYELRDALAQEGCALCHLAQRAVERFLDNLLYENVNDPGVRRDVRQARGFCNLHAWQLRDQRGALGIAILHRDVLSTVTERVQKTQPADARPTPLLRVRAPLVTARPMPAAATLASDLAPQRICLACQTREDAEEIYIHVLLEHINDPEITEGFSRSGSLCLPHFRRVLQQVRDEATARRLIAMQLGAWEQLLAELDEFIRKQDYRFRDEGLGAEGDSWIRAVARVSGERKVW